MNLYPNLPLPTALYLYSLASEGPHPGLSSNPTSSMRPSPPTATPLPHSLSLCGLPRKKEVHPLYQESLKALVSSKDRDLGPAPFQDARSTCAQWDPEVGPSKKGLESRKELELHTDISTLGSNGPETPSSASLDGYPKLPLSSPVFQTRLPPRCYFYVGKCLDHHRVASRVSDYPKMWKTNREHM